MLLLLTLAPPVAVPVAEVGVTLPSLPGPPSWITAGLFDPGPLPLTFLPVLDVPPARVDELVDFDRLSRRSWGLLTLITTPPGKSSSLSLAAIVSLSRVDRGGGAGRAGGPALAEAERPLWEEDGPAREDDGG